MHMNHELILKYFKELEYCSKHGWKKQYDSLKSFHGMASLIRKMSLINPESFKNENIARRKGTEEIQKLIQGPRAFKRHEIHHGCQAVEIWGYNCPFKSNDLVFDHDFPYSLGGPTSNAFNKKVLCRWHNMVKSNDIHNFDWEGLLKEYNYYQSNGRVHWIDDQINKIKFELNL